MFTSLPREETRRSAGAHLRRITAALAAVTVSVLAWAAVIPAASAATLVIPVPGPGGAYETAPAASGGTVQVITTGGMPGWQITLIVLAAALVAATAAVTLDRIRASRRSASAAG
jgi:hypothetical protein